MRARGCVRISLIIGENSIYIRRTRFDDFDDWIDSTLLTGAKPKVVPGASFLG